VAPVVTYRHVEVGIELTCTPFFVKVVGVNLQIEYRIDQKGPYQPGESHDDGSLCLIDLKSITVYWDRENEGFPMNSLVTEWSKCCGYGARAGREDTLLDDDIVISITRARPRRPDGGARVMKRHLSDATYHIEDKLRLVITYGKFIEEVTRKAQSNVFQAFQNRVNWAIPKDSETSSLPLREVPEVAAMVAQELKQVIRVAVEGNPKLSKPEEALKIFYKNHDVATFKSRKPTPGSLSDVYYDEELDTFVDSPEQDHMGGNPQGKPVELRFGTRN
jgi:hypothetical protein